MPCCTRIQSDAHPFETPARKHLDPRRSMVQRRGRPHHVDAVKLASQQIEMGGGSRGFHDDELADLDVGRKAVAQAPRMLRVAPDAVLEVGIAIRCAMEVEPMCIRCRVVHHEIEREVPAIARPAWIRRPAASCARSGGVHPSTTRFRPRSRTPGSRRESRRSSPCARNGAIGLSPPL